jgi:hypothetical protein
MGFWSVLALAVCCGLLTARIIGTLEKQTVTYSPSDTRRVEMRTMTAAPARVHATPLNVARRVVSKPAPRRASAPSTRSSKSARANASEMTSTTASQDLDIDAPDPSAIYDVVDEDEMLYGASNTFPIKPDELVVKCKSALRAGFANIGDSLAEDFEFIGPVVGPLPRDAFVNAVGGFDLTTGFPDMKSNYHHFRVDPFETNRTTGTHTGKLAGRFEATGTAVECPPQALSMTFNESGKIVKITVGVVMDRTMGNTGGLGGVFGLFSAIGSPLPFPEARPWKMSKRYKFFQWLGRLSAKKAEAKK